MKTKTKENIFKIPKFIEIMSDLLFREYSTSTMIAKNLDITYSHVVRIITELEKIKYLETVKDGRTRYIRLTEKGNRYATNCNNILKIKKDVELEKIGENK